MDGWSPPDAAAVCAYRTRDALCRFRVVSLDDDDDDEHVGTACEWNTFCMCIQYDCENGFGRFTYL